MTQLPVNLKAEYTGPTESKTFTLSLPFPYTSTTKENILYLSALRSSVVRLQDEINAFLTSKMEEDKALALNGGGDDKQEEEKYGREIQDNSD